MINSLMSFRARLLLSVLAFALFGACGNPPEARRAELRDLATDARARGLTHEERVSTASDILAGRSPDSLRPELRWQAAQNLGNLADMSTFDLLFRKGLSSTSDDSASVRKECIIALGKLPYGSLLDARRKLLVQALDSRLAFDNQSSIATQLEEQDPSVRLACMGTLVTLATPNSSDLTLASGIRVTGYQDAVLAVWSACDQLVRRATSAEQRAQIDEPRVNAALKTHAIEALVRLTDVAEADVRQKHQELEEPDFMQWLKLAVARMPSVEQVESEAIVPPTTN